MDNLAADFFQFAPSPLAILDANAHILQLNLAWQRQLGGNIGQDVRTYIHAQDLAKLQNLTNLKNSTNNICFVIRWQTENIESCWLEWQICQVKHPVNQIEYYYVVARDVTEQKISEQELISSRERLELAIRGANHGLWDWDLRSNEVYFSTRWKSLLGYYEHEIPNHIDALLQCIHPDDFPRVWQALEVYLDRGSDKYECLHRMLHKDGSQRWVLAQAAALWDEQGQAYRMVGTYVDVTPYKKLEQALQESEDLLNAIFTVTQIGICVTDEYGDFVHVNPAYCKLYGYSMTELLGQNFTMLFPEHKKSLALQRHKQFLAGDNQQNQDAWQAINKYGQLLDIEITMGLLQRPNGQKFKVTTVTDVTARKRAEAERNRLFNLSVDMQAILDFEGNLKEINAAWERILGWENSELLSKPVTALLHPDDLQEFANAKYRLQQGISILDFCIRVKCKYSDYKFMSWNIYPIPEQKALYTIIRDVTEAKLSAQKIQQQQDFIRLVLDTIPNIIFVCDQDGYYIFANKTYANLLNLSVDDLIGHNLNSGLSSGELCFEINKQQLCFQIEKKEFVRQDGKKLILVVGTDITERKKQEEALKSSEERLRIVTAGAPILLFAFDKNGIITFARGKALSIFNLQDDEAIGSSVFKLCQHYNLSDYAAAISQVLRTGETITSNILINNYTLESTLSCHYDENQQIASVIGVAVDISKRHQLELQYQELIAELETILNNSVIGIAYVKNEKFIYANQKLSNLLGYKSEQLATLPFHILYDSPVSYQRTKERACAAFKQGQDFDEAQLIHTQNSELIWARMVAKAVDAKDLSKGLIWIIEDITLQKQAEQNLRLTATIFETSADAILVTDLKNRILRVNPAFSKITGYTAEEAHGKHVNMLSSGRHPQQFYVEMWKQIANTGHWQGEIWNRRKDGEIYVAWLSISVISDENNTPQHYMAILSDISRLQEDIEAVRYLASYDSLTNLPNRLLFHDNLLRTQAWAKRHYSLFALLFIDLDNFKPINDTLGHAIGDLVLQQVAQIMAGCVRETDTVARIGGDEFVIILSEICHPQDAALVSHKLLQQLQTPFAVEKHEIQISASIGISIYPDDTDNINDLIEYADIAMYVAKRHGKAGYAFYSETNKLCG
jgi:diguanylate cyclase (GGDEF)-like protein/PAS domain S-box-containing protein